MLNLDWRKWFDRMQPQTLQISTMLLYLNGFFAFAYFDHVQQICWLARDRMGIKPVWLCSHSGGHFFASEHKALYPLGMGRELNPTAVRCYFRMGYIPGPISVFKNGQQLMPGHWVKLSKSGFEEPKAWWSLPVGMDSEIAPIPSYQKAVQRVRALVEEAVADRLISDVPLGSFLSGGVDSSVVVAVASQRVKDFIHSALDLKTSLISTKLDMQNR